MKFTIKVNNRLYVSRKIRLLAQNIEIDQFGERKSSYHDCKVESCAES